MTYKYSFTARNGLFHQQIIENQNCDIQLISRSDLMSNKNVPEIYCCVSCNIRYRSKYELDLHTSLLNHEPLTKFINMRFSPKKAIYTFKCNICERKFGYKQTLDNHMLQHSGKVI